MGPQGEEEWLNGLCPSRLAPQQVLPTHFCVERLAWTLCLAGKEAWALAGNLSSACSFAWSRTWVQLQELFETGWLGPEMVSPRYLSESYSVCTGLVCIVHSSVVQWQLCTVPLVCSLGCKRPGCLRKTEVEQLLLWCRILQSASLSFVLFRCCIFAASLNAELLEGIRQLS